MELEFRASVARITQLHEAFNRARVPCQDSLNHENRIHIIS